LKEVNNERRDDFRRIQEESRKMSERELQAYRKADKVLDGTLRRELSRIYGNEINASRSRRGNGNEPVVSTESFTIYKDIDASLFHDIFEINRNYLENGELVDLHSVETTEDGIG